MTQAAAQSAAPHASSLVAGREALLAEAAVAVAAIVTAIHVQCIVPSVRTVEMRLRYLFSRAKTDPFIAAIVTGHNVQTAQMTGDHTGNFL
jgi:uncharacterized protein YqfA (UPF0365 family)